MIRLQAHPHKLHFRKPAATSRGAQQERALWLIEATDSESGATGAGECGVVPGLSVDDLLDLDDRISQVMELFNAARVSTSDVSAVAPEQSRSRFSGLVVVDALLAPVSEQLQPLPALHFAIESALLSLLNGGTQILFASAFTTGAVGLPTHGLIWMDSPAGMLEQVRTKVAAGFDVIKIKVGALPWVVEIEMLRTLRTMYPFVELRLDANCAFEPNEAFSRLQDLAPLGVAVLEEPIRYSSLEEYAALIERSPIPICLDETLLHPHFRENLSGLLRDLRPQHVVLKPSLLGGFANVARLIETCDSLKIDWWINSLLESAVGHSAICQFTGATGDVRVHGLGTGSLFADNFLSPIVLRGNRLWWHGASQVA